MSLNGLDDPKVREAHEAAVAEAGGWFLLKYASRDEVELLARGNGGIVEIRNNIAQYEETSPLYGLLRYRRRNVIIKYLPEDCSRLVQARVSVHLNSMCERFAPYDTVFSIANAKELKDTKLSAACSLHAASGSTSSSTSSLRRRRLMEIAEEEEEEQRAKRQSVVKEEEAPRPDAGEEPPVPALSATSSTYLVPPITLNSQLATSPEHAQFSGGTEPPTFSGAPRPVSPAKSVDAERRNSTQSSRPDFYSYSSYPYSKNRVKLGPRPSLDVSGRPRTAGGYRPISTIPAGFKLFSKSSKKAKAADSLHEQSDPSIQAEIPNIIFLAASIPIPEDPSNTDFPRPTTSSGVSVKSALTSTGATKMTPEKARLIKAMQLREKKKNRLGGMPVPTIETPSLEPESPASPNHAEAPETIPEESEQNEDLLTSEAEAAKRRSMSNADSAISIEGPNDLASVDTRTDSHPPSPNAASSEIGESTKASSLSESTDETLQPSAEEKPESLPSPQQPAQSKVSDGPSVADDTLAHLGVTENESIQVSRVEAVSNVEDATARGRVEVRVDKRTVALDVDNKPAKDAEPCHQDAGENKVPQQGVDEVDDLATSIEPSLHLHARADEVTESDTAAEEATGPAMAVQRPALPISKFSSSAGKDIAEQQKAGSPQYQVPMSRFAKTWDSKPLSGSQDGGALVPSIATPPRTPGQEADARLEEGGQQPPGSERTSIIDEKRARRRAIVEPVRTDMKVADPDASGLSDDEDLLDELQSATVEEARPMTVSKSKSPITPVFPSLGIPKQGPESEQTTPKASRAVSNPARSGLLARSETPQSSARSVSSGAAAFLHKITQQQSAASLAPKQPGKIGSSISQRIKALEKFSSSTGGGAGAGAGAGGGVAGGGSGSVSEATPPKGGGDRPSTSFFSVRKTTMSAREREREPSKSPLVADRATNSIAARGPTPSPPQTRESSPETARSVARRERSGSMASRLSMFEGGSIPQMPPARTESIQVTARIIRDPNQPLFPRAPQARSNSKDFASTPLDLKQSLLVVDHKKAAPTAFAAPAAPVAAVSAAMAAAAAAAPSPVIALGPGPEESQADADRKPRESLLQRRLSRSTQRSQSQDRASQMSLDDSRNRSKDDDDDEAGGKRPRRRSSLSVVRDYIKDRRNTLRSARSPSTDSLHHLNLPAPPAAPQTPSRSPSRPPSVHQNFSLPSRLSIGSRRSSVSRDAPLTGTLSPSLMSETSPGNGTSAGIGTEEAGERRSSKSRLGPGSPPEAAKNRATRFIRRLSSSLGGGRKNAAPTISPTVAEEDAADVEASTSTITSSRGSTLTYQPSMVAFLGDVNVQFPDNLLWKRRTLCLDSHGFLVLSPVQGAAGAVGTPTPTPSGRDKAGGTTKRYHLSDFRPPYTPEVEVQELPNSVVLDFLDGSGLQIASGDRAGQLNVLHVLQDAHRSHTMFGQ